ncbi:MAG: dockerin type I repeat-containing protein [Ruminococcus sp.]|nr:dockerin type I repeat-containing protein [Ruminococcus sp.]
MKALKRTLAIFLSLVMMLSALPMISAGAETVYKELVLNEKQSVKVADDAVTLSFTPEKDGWYKFYSMGYEDPYATLYDSDFEMIDECDDYDEMNFSICAYLEASTIYYLEVNAYLYEVASCKFDVCVEETIGVESAVITQYPYDMTCIEGFEDESVDFGGLCVDFTLSDESVVNWSYDEGEFEVENCSIIFDRSEIASDKVTWILTCGKAKIEIDYTIVENPIEKIEFVSENQISYYKNTHGYNSENGNFYYRIDIPQGSVLNVYYKDGTKKEITDFSYDREVSITSDQYIKPWDVGTNYITMSYYGVETQVPVEILTSPVKSVKVNSVPTREYYIFDDEWGYTNEVGKYMFTPTDLSGLSFTVEYLDGTTKTFDDSDIDMYEETIGGYDYEVRESYAVKPMKVKATLVFMGYEFSYNINVVEAPIKNIEVIWGPENCFYEQRYSIKLDGTELRVKYSDGSEKVIVLDESNTHYYVSEYLAGYVTDGKVKINFYQVENEYAEPMLLFQAFDSWAIFDGLYVEENREIKDIKVENFTPDGDKLKVTLTYVDESEETLVFKTLGLEKNSYTGMTVILSDTENGLVFYEMESKVENGVTVSYVVRLFGKEFEFEKINYENGDVDMDNTVSIMDATAIALHLAEIEKLSEFRLELADTDYDGVVSIMDATQIQLDLAQI